MAPEEVYKAAFDSEPGTNLAGIPISKLRLPTPYLSHGLPYDEACAKHISQTYRASKVFIVASKTLAANTDKLGRLVSAIGQDSIVGVRGGVVPHTPWSDILSITAECKKLNVDCLVTLGAGSITDCCKIVTLCLANGINSKEELSRYSVESVDIPTNLVEPKIPLITIPTSLSGGEYFSLAGGTDDVSHHKHGFLHSGMGSKLIILDPELCLTTPEYHWLSTGVRSVDHCVEALCCLEGTADSDARAEHGLRLLAPNLLKCKADPSDVEARRQCQLAVGPAMSNVRAGVTMGGSHAIGHQLGPLGVPHGVTSCIMCPAVMKYNIRHGQDNPEIAKRQHKIMQILWSEPDTSRCFQQAGLVQDQADLGDLLDVYIRALSLPRTLGELGISVDVIPALSRRALDDFWAPTNPVPLLKAEQVQEILEAVA